MNPTLQYLCAIVYLSHVSHVTFYILGGCRVMCPSLINLCRIWLLLFSLSKFWLFLVVDWQACFQCWRHECLRLLYIYYTWLTKLLVESKMTFGSGLINLNRTVAFINKCYWKCIFPQNIKIITNTFEKTLNTKLK